MQQTFNSNHFTKDGNPAGGHSSATGIDIDWQNGPLREQGTDEPTDPNGAFVETVIAIAADRIEFYQASRFNSDYNQEALDHLNAALDALHRRTADREDRQVEGTHQA